MTAAKDIQIDMFEVQLGAALLMQFVIDGETVRVLADAGVKASGYAKEKVRDALLAMFKDEDKIRIDLVIGTHYDEDHLAGLVPIIKSERFAIGEAWMPPVVNDTVLVALDQPLREPEFLAAQFSSDENGAVLKSYQEAKLAEIEALISVRKILTPESREGSSETASLCAEDEQIEKVFERYVANKDAHDIDHCSDLESDEDADIAGLIEMMRRETYFGYHPYRTEGLEWLKSAARDWLGSDMAITEARSRSLTHLVRSVAKDAINAKALNEVVQALKLKNIPVQCEVIRDGVPRRYRWHCEKRRFIAARSDAAGLVFDLLGPSVSLVKKHRHRLPVLEAAKLAISFRLEIRSITPSNQLSYIGCFRHAGQSILVSGDAGCVDFKQDRTTYYPKLLSALKPLHVIQVAHHGGNNSHFYPALAAASYPDQDEPSFLLLSHATSDRTRPSNVFRDFLLTSLGEGGNIHLLFTSEPRRERVEDYLGAIHHAVGKTADRGNIRLIYRAGGWSVAQHAINLNPPPAKIAALRSGKTITAPRLRFPRRKGSSRHSQ